MSEKVDAFLRSQGILLEEFEHHGVKGMKWGVRKSRKMEVRAAKGEARLAKNDNLVGKANGKSVVKGILSGAVSLTAAQAALSMGVTTAISVASLPVSVVPILVVGTGALAVTALASAGVMSKSIGDIRNVNAAEKVRTQPALSRRSPTAAARKKNEEYLRKAGLLEMLNDPKLSVSEKRDRVRSAG